jgi:hypothetical protein
MVSTGYFQIYRKYHKKLRDDGAGTGSSPIESTATRFEC